MNRYFDKSLGYWKVLAPDHPSVAHMERKHQWVLEHRLIMEKHLGRYLKPTEYVIHQDGNRTNNDISNLILGNKKVQNKIHKRVKAFLRKGGSVLRFINKKYLGTAKKTVRGRQVAKS